jgi:5-methylcytosine-specific restriction endonuclease McrA
MSPKVLDRDDYTCQKCGKQDRHNLVAHHKDGNSLNNTVENLVAVCRSCNNSLARTKEAKEAREKAKVDKWRKNYYERKTLREKNGKRWSQ